MSGEIKMSAGTASRLESLHAQASAAITAVAGSLPPSGLDAGEGAPYLDAILAELVKHASALAEVNVGAGQIVKQVANDFYKNEEAISSSLRKIESAMDGAS